MKTLFSINRSLVLLVTLLLCLGTQSASAYPAGTWQRIPNEPLSIKIEQVNRTTWTWWFRNEHNKTISFDFSYRDSTGLHNDVFIPTQPGGNRGGWTTFTSEGFPQQFFIRNRSWTVTPPQPPSVPVISISKPYGTTFGTISRAGSFSDLIFSISNTGRATLTLSGSPYVRLSGSSASFFSVTSQPVGSISAGGSASFVIRYAPTASGSHSATVTVTSNDSSNGTVTFTVSGTASLPVSNEPVYFYYMSGGTSMCVWQRSGSVWTERYTNGTSSTFDVIGRSTLTNIYVNNALGHIARRRGDGAEVFIPDVNQAARAYGLWYRVNSTSPYGYLGTMFSIR